MRFLTALLITILSAIAVVFVINLVFDNTYKHPKKIKYGISFAPKYATYLGLDWQKTYLQILNELQVKNLRIPTYWDVLEKEEGKLDFSQTDFMLNEAEKAGAKVVLVVGARQPRWPECHIPKWARNLPIEKRQQKILEFVKIVVQRYKNAEAIGIWQIENEPLVSWFGEKCDKLNKQFLQKEIQLVKQIDSTRPMMITDSGEWGNWVESMKITDILGVSLYRKSFNSALNAYVNYPISTWMYLVKVKVSQFVTSQNKRILISELQSEPWTKKAVLDTPLAEQIKLFTLQDFQQTVLYAKKTGIDEAYLWGAEWWYYMAKNGHLEYLEYAKTLFK